MVEPVLDQSAQSQKDETNKPGLEGLQTEVDEPEAPLTGDAEGLENGFIDNLEPVEAHLDEDQTNSGNQLEDENPELLLSETLDPIFVENFEAESPSGVVDDNVECSIDRLAEIPANHLNEYSEPHGRSEPDVKKSRDFKETQTENLDDDDEEEFKEFDEILFLTQNLDSKFMEMCEATGSRIVENFLEEAENKFVDLSRWNDQNEEVAQIKLTVEKQTKIIEDILVRFFR